MIAVLFSHSADLLAPSFLFMVVSLAVFQHVSYKLASASAFALLTTSVLISFYLTLSLYNMCSGNNSMRTANRAQTHAHIPGPAILNNHYFFRTRTYVFFNYNFMAIDCDILVLSGDCGCGGSVGNRMFFFI